MPTEPESAELDSARRLVPQIAARAREIEAARRLPDEFVRAFADAGLVGMAVPTRYGGRESHPLDLLRVIEEISYADGSAGWCLMNYQTTALVSGILPKRWSEAIFAGSNPAVPAGVLAPTGRGRWVAGGIVVSGRWGFASGCPGANWLLGTAVMDRAGSDPQAVPERAPNVLLPIFSGDQFVIHDTWHVSGLCGSGSHDVEVGDAFVPEGRWITLGDPPAVDTPLFRIPIVSLFPPCVVAVALGIARAALESFAELARRKVPAQRSRPLAERATAQAEFAEAEALVAAGRSHVFETTEALWELAVRDQPMDAPTGVETRRRARLASCHAAASAARAVDLLYTAGGSSSIFSDHPLQRHWRDVHAATQHIQIARGNYEAMGRLRLTDVLEGPL